MKFRLSLCLVLGTLAACHSGKPDLSGDTPVKIKDFLAVFPVISNTFTASDTNLTKLADTTTIGYKALIQFVPDSTLDGIPKKHREKLHIHPVGIISKNKIQYLLMNLSESKQPTRLFVYVLDKDNKYIASKMLLSTGSEDGYLHAVSINREPTFLLSREKNDKDNQLKFSKEGWTYSSSAASFMLILNDSNEGQDRSAIINPIDTLPRKNKFSGDYAEDKRNFISIRDTKSPNVYAFFIHFEKDNGACTGELKGEMKLSSPTTAQFTENGDPCVIDFHFEGRDVTLKERGSCGNHRGIRCYFDDTFTKKREPRPSRK